MEIKKSNQPVSQVSQDALNIRTAVFVKEQGVSPELEYDHVTDATTVYVGYVDERPVVTARMKAEGPLMHIQRVATVKSARKHGYAKILLQQMHTDAKQAGFKGATLGAQLTAMGFYQTLGYQAVSEIFLDAGIQHRQMQVQF